MKIGMMELLVIFIVALVVLGPDKLPVYAKKFGEALRQFKKYSSDATKDIRESIIDPLEEAQKPLKEAMEPITDLQKSVENEMKDLKKSFRDVGKSTKSSDPEKENGGDKTEEAEETEPAAIREEEDGSGLTGEEDLPAGEEKTADEPQAAEEEKTADEPQTAGEEKTADEPQTAEE